jgi:hypothetical protein
MSPIGVPSQPVADCSAFTRVAACTHALSPICDTPIEDFGHFVTSMTAPITSGWSACRVGFSPTGKRRLCTAHTHNGRRAWTRKSIIKVHINVPDVWSDIGTTTTLELRPAGTLPAELSSSSGRIPTSSKVQPPSIALCDYRRRLSTSVMTPAPSTAITMRVASASTEVKVSYQLFQSSSMRWRLSKARPPPIRSTLSKRRAFATKNAMLRIVARVLIARQHDCPILRPLPRM